MKGTCVCVCVDIYIYIMSDYIMEQFISEEVFCNETLATYILTYLPHWRRKQIEVGGARLFLRNLDTQMN